MPSEGPSTRVRRLPELQRFGRADLDAVLDAGFIAHLAIVDDGQPLALPMAYVRDDDRLLLHGSTGSRLVRTLRAGAPASATVTLFDGLVVARSAFESSMQYRCAMVFGRCRPVADADADTALQALTEGLLPGRTAEVRASTRKELAATSVLELSIERWSVKVNDGEPEDPPEDLATDVWAGVLPTLHGFGPPQPASDLRRDIPVSASVLRRAGYKDPGHR